MPRLPSGETLGTRNPRGATGVLSYQAPVVPNTYASANLQVPVSSSGQGLKMFGDTIQFEADKIQRAARKAQEKEDVMVSNTAFSQLQISQSAAFEAAKAGDMKSFTHRVVSGFDETVDDLASRMSPAQSSLFVSSAISARTSTATNAIKYQSGEFRKAGIDSYKNRQVTNAAAATRDVDNLKTYYAQASLDAANAFRVGNVDDYTSSNLAAHKQVSKSVANQLLMSDPIRLKQMLTDGELLGLDSAEKLAFDTRARAAIDKMSDNARQDKVLSLIGEELGIFTNFTQGTMSPQMVDDFRSAGPDDGESEARERSMVADYLDKTMYMTPEEKQDFAIETKVKSMQATAEAKGILGIRSDIKPSRAAQALSLAHLTSKYVQMFGHHPTKSVSYTAEGLPKVPPKKGTTLTDLLEFQRDIKLSADAQLMGGTAASTFLERLLPGINARVKSGGFWDANKFGFEGARAFAVDVDVEPYAPVFLSVMEHIDKTTYEETDAERAIILEHAMVQASRTDLFAIEDLDKRQKKINTMVDGIIKSYEVNKAPVLRSFQGDITNYIIRYGGALDKLQPGGSVKSDRAIEKPKFVLQESYDTLSGGTISKSRIMDTSEIEGIPPEDVVRTLEERGVISNTVRPDKGAQLMNSNPQDRLLKLIGKHEASGNYEAIFGGEEKGLTEMTFDEVAELQQQMVKSGKESSAVGKYQVIRKTLPAAMAKAGLTGSDTFSEENQDKIAMVLLRRRGYDAFLRGEITKEAFMKNLSKEWASLPKDKSGKSYYAGVGSNKAHASPEEVMDALALA